MMKRSPIRAAAAIVCGVIACGLIACGVIAFDVSQDVPQQTVQGSPLGGLLPGFLSAPFPITIDIKQETAKRSTGPAHSANLKQVEFRITPADAATTFDFVDEIHIYVESSKAGTTLPKVEVANLAPVPKGQKTIDLAIVKGVDLLPYINEGAVISASATGHQPAMTTSYVGTVVVTVHI
jgi:hypothetical protein